MLLIAAFPSRASWLRVAVPLSHAVAACVRNGFLFFAALLMVQRLPWRHAGIPGMRRNLRVPCKPCTAVQDHHHSSYSQRMTIHGHPGTYSSWGCRGFGVCLGSVAGSVPAVEPDPLNLCRTPFSSPSSKEVWGRGDRLPLPVTPA